MLRSLYRCALRLHPPAFRHRFSEEMLSIFEHSPRGLAAVKLMLDALVSLVRQWTLRPEFWYAVPADSPQPLPDGIPTFYTIGPFRPRSAAVIHGIVLTTVVFCLTCFAVKYSWIRVLHVHIPEVQFESQQWAAQNAAYTSPSNLIAQRSSQEHPAPSHLLPLSRQSPPPTSNAATRISQSLANENVASTAKSGRDFADRKLSEPAGANDTTTPAGIVAVGQQDDSHLDVAERRQVVNEIITHLSHFYVDPELGKRMSFAIESHRKHGDYDREVDRESFARLLTLQLRGISQDPHLEVVYSKPVLPQQTTAQTAEAQARYRRLLKQQNCTFEKVRVLPHNIGYLKMNSFPDRDVCEEMATAAMLSLNRADAIIFDLRDNRGGQPEMTALIAAYLFDHPEYWYNPRENTTQRSWTRSPIPGSKLADKPVYILTSSSTYSGAEQFCYNLQMLKRAVLIGERTGGAAHAAVFYRINEHFGIAIPETKPINPFANADWQGTGVEPDVRVQAADALITAQKLAARKLGKK